ncbi:hypothetical protein ONZ45_g15245 [Pleurotus djamor]|nr:hypothetical protein ONZ45_g15245 [Pleurotus djamor]
MKSRSSDVPERSRRAPKRARSSSPAPGSLPLIAGHKAEHALSNHFALASFGVHRQPSPSSESSLVPPTRFPSPWNPNHFGSHTSSSSASILSLNSVPSAAPSLSGDELTHLLHLPLAISTTIRLPERLLALPTEKESPSISVQVPFWVLEYADRLVADIQRWKTVYDLSDLPSLLSVSVDAVSAHSDEGSADLTVDQLFNDYHETLDANLATLRNAFNDSEKFSERMTDLAKAMSSMYLSYHLRSLNIIQQERLAIRWALHDIVAPMAHWLGRPSALLNQLSKAVITPAMSNYRADILTKKSVDTLIPGQWVDDNIINYFSGNIKGSHHVILGDHADVLFCSPLFWSTLRHTANLKELSLNSELFHSQAISKIQRILMPINVDQSHWILSYVNVKDRLIQIYDSFINPPPLPPSTAKNTKQWLPSHREERRYNKEIQAPIQGNTVDCGLYVVMFVRHLTSGFTVNHAGLPKEAMVGKLWISLTTARLRFWMELPKPNEEDWKHVPQFLRSFPMYKPYAQMMLPGLPGDHNPKLSNGDGVVWLSTLLRYPLHILSQYPSDAQKDSK